MARRNHNYAIYFLVVILILTFVVYPFFQMTGKQVALSTTSQVTIGNPEELNVLVKDTHCDDLTWWNCIWTVNCWWETDNKECVIWNETKEIQP